MSVTNLAVMRMIGGANFELAAGPAAAQATATRLNNTLCRCTRGVATGSFILPSILSGEANQEIWLVNDTAGALNVYPAVGEKNGGTLNAAVSVASGAAAVFIPVLNITNNPSSTDWRNGVVT